MARAADNNVDRIFAELRAAEAGHPGPLIRTAEELRSYVAEQEHQGESSAALTFHEEFPTTPPKPKQ